MTITLRAIHPVLVAKDVAASIRFFRDLGFTLIFQDTTDGPGYAALMRDNVEVHIQWADPEQWSYPTDRPTYRILVNDVDALYRELADSGKITSSTGQSGPFAAPANTPWGTREFHLRDPGGNGLQFYCPL
jgi:catechol 2,3-dioxygenase-like lactoylglutathione lyase family enzyme